MIGYCFYVCPLNCPKKLLLSFNLKTCQIIGPKRLKWVKTYINGPKNICWALDLAKEAQ